ncbi:hypothetical protein ACFZAR_36375 [Streptomyces sp. NPDC008222]|uniref:hypothetical protein n=1 Tax=Streptomyces sp. NPDC008222 TaxID=3364820 RepID=UPI0036ED15B1
MRDTQPEPTQIHGQHTDDPLRQLAEIYETTFHEYGLSLTDDTAAGAYRVTLKLVEKILEGAQVQGILQEDQRIKVAELLHGIEDLPGLLA